MINGRIDVSIDASRPSHQKLKWFLTVQLKLQCIFLWNRKPKAMLNTSEKKMKIENIKRKLKESKNENFKVSKRFI